MQADEGFDVVLHSKHQEKARANNSKRSLGFFVTVFYMGCMECIMVTSG